MAKRKKFTNELNYVFNYINDNLIIDYPSNVISSEYFILSILENNDCTAYRLLSKTMFQDSIKALKEWYYDYLSRNSTNLEQGAEYDEVFDKAIEEAEKFTDENNFRNINSANVLASLIKLDTKIAQTFKTVGVTLGQLNKIIKENTTTVKDTDETSKANDKPIKHVKPEKKEKTPNKKPVETISVINQSSKGIHPSDNEKGLINLNDLAFRNKIDVVFHNEKVYEQIFKNFLRRDFNNVILVGKHGVGRTSTVKNISNLIISNNVNKSFRNKVLYEIDPVRMGSGNVILKGVFENKFKPFLNEIKNSGNAIIFIDNLYRKMDENETSSILNMVLDERSIPFICTATQTEYDNIISEYPMLKKKFQKVVLEEHSVEDIIDIVSKTKERYETFHNIKFTDSAIDTCVKMAKRYVTDVNLPESVFNLLDNVGANKSFEEKEDIEVIKLESKLKLIQQEKERVKNSSVKKDYEMIDSLTKQEIAVKSELNILEKERNLNKERIEVTVDDIKIAISEKTGLPLENIGLTEKEKLKGLNDYVKQFVIGQDEAVEDVCRVVKRQRVGLANPDKPSVFMFLGSSGTGKTLLAKKIAEKVYGDEKYLVRLDMSEYADKTSTNKLIGSSAGYVGYDNGGILTNAIKEKKHCVLLLDEIEKSDEEVHNMFLQMFDEGRMTDNKGNLVDFKNVIVIMTSNVGASEASLRGKGFGFNKDASEKSKEIINSELKKKFKPEFINRIDKIVHFNKLTDENLIQIIKIEIGKIEEKLNNISYSLDSTLKEGRIIDEIFEKIKNSKEYGARPIIREVQRMIEDRITDYLIDNEIDTNHCFTYDELFS